MKDNTYLSRGITKEGKEVVGYYVFDECRKKHYLFRFVARKNHPPFELRDEITSPPQKCLGIRDCEGELAFEEDIIDIDGKLFVITWFGTKCFGLVECDNDKPFSRKIIISLDEFLKNETEKFTFKIIHPTNKDEIESRSWR